MIKFFGLKSARRRTVPMDHGLRDEGDTARDQRDWRTALDAYASHLAIYPSDFAIWVQHGHMSKELGDLDAAAASYARASELQPDDADVLFHRGYLLKRQGDMVSAAEMFRASYHIDGSAAAARELVDPAILMGLARAGTDGTTPPRRLIGALDGVSAGVLVGWAVNPDQPDEAAEIEVLIDGCVLLTERVTLLREDVNRAGLASGHTGFRIRLTGFVSPEGSYEVSVRLAGTGETLVNSPLSVMPTTEARDWLSRHSDTSHEDLVRTQKRMNDETSGQLLSIVMPVFNTKAGWLREALDSVLAQWCSRWELICVNDCSPEAHVAEILAEYAGRDRRIRVINAELNGGIAKTTNIGIRSATGDYIAFLDHDDYLEPEAVYRILDAGVNRAGLIYSDEIITGEDLNQIEQFVARPAFSHDHYLSHPYFVHFVAVRQDIAVSCAGYDETMSISADVDFVLRVIEHAEHVAHVPAMLYRWRTHESSAGHVSMGLVTEATTSAHNRHLARIGSSGVSGPGLGFNVYRTEYPDDAETTLVVIPTKDGLDVLRPCIDSVLRTTSRDNCDVLIVDHESMSEETKRYFSEIEDVVKIARYEGEFNFSSINNFAVKEFGKDYKYILFLNNDIEAITPGWLERMRSLSARPEVGAVGATLLYGTRLVQHAGVILGLNGVADHAHKFSALDNGSHRHAGYNCSLTTTREYSAVTAACMMVRREIFVGVGGFDEELAIGFNDTDLCLRIGSLGYRILNDAETLLYHHESATRSTTDQVEHPNDAWSFARRWAHLLSVGDPFYSPLLSRENDHTIAKLDDAYGAVRVRSVRAALRPLGLGVLRLVPPPVHFPIEAPAL